MRLVTWNCRVGGFRKKAKRMAPLRPDVLAVQEVEPIDAATVFDGERQPTYRYRSAEPAFPKRGIGMFSYTETTLELADLSDPMYSFRRFRAKHGDLDFQVIAVWPWQTRSRATSYRQAHVGIQRHADWIRSRPTVILGDFNANAQFKGTNWSELLDLMKSVGLGSAYHMYYPSEPFGSEKRPTHFHKGKSTAPFHLDYCFLPIDWLPRISSVEVGTYDDWHDVSDHAPLIVDLNL
jgi:exonuclease III